MIRGFATRESFIPQGARKVTDKQSDAVAYLYEANGKLYFQVYYGKQAKPVAHYRARNEAERESAITRHFQSRRTRSAYFAERAAKRKAYVNDYKPGDIVNTCWGYEQTNREFYEVISSKGRKVTLRRVAVGSYATGWASENVAPLPGQFIGPAFERFATAAGIKIGKHGFTMATRTDYSEAIPGVRVYRAAHTSSYA